MLDKGVCLRFYKRKEVQEALVLHAQNKEVGLRYGDSFGKRPDTLTYPRDVLELALQGATSFHASEELWGNPLELSSESNRKDLDGLRTGWDLVLDVDCKIMEYSRICADLIIAFLKYCEVKEISVKFSGNKGFHVGVPFEAFPPQVGDKLTKNLFPEAPKKIAFYVKENIKKELGRRILEFEKNDISKVMEKTGSEKEKVIYYISDKFGTRVPFLNVEPFLEIDTILLSSRHLYRMPYSLHEKSGLVSLPLNPEKVLQFEKQMARPENIKAPLFPFLDRKAQGESARRLLLQAFDFETKREEMGKNAENKKSFEEIRLECPIKEDFFPPCMKAILNGLQDGRKRGVFCLANFLGKTGWDKKSIQECLSGWNQEKNPQPLREVYIKGQMSSFKPGEKLPTNCNNEAYYQGIGVCHPDSLCHKIKNPVNYTLLRWRRHLREKEENESKEETDF